MTADFSLLLFSTDPHFIRRAVAAGVDSVIVDWERIGKESRQAEADTQISSDTVEDLRVVRATTEANVICRINGFGPWTSMEVEQAIGSGADEILLPMVRKRQEVEAVLDLVGERCQVSILIETTAAVRDADTLTSLPIRRAYVGLNDLSLDRGSANIFTAVTDGTLEAIRARVERPFGFGGLTDPERGSPIPCRLLIGEMARLQCRFSFLRRSFHRDVVGRDVGEVIDDILSAIHAATLRGNDEVERDREALCRAVAHYENADAKAAMWTV